MPIGAQVPSRRAPASYGTAYASFVSPILLIGILHGFEGQFVVMQGINAFAEIHNHLFKAH
jgi:hypothetical protein